jgi:hypothetical protein
MNSGTVPCTKSSERLSWRSIRQGPSSRAQTWRRVQSCAMKLMHQLPLCKQRSVQPARPTFRSLGRQSQIRQSQVSDALLQRTSKQVHVLHSAIGTPAPRLPARSSDASTKKTWLQLPREDGICDFLNIPTRFTKPPSEAPT